MQRGPVAQEERLRKGVGQLLKAHRSGEGKWRVFPFWYTVLALAEMDVPEASAELRHVAPALERAARRAPGAGVFARRRQQLAQRALGKC
jgi:hypothetical protein